MSEYERERKVDPYDGRNCSVAGGAGGTHCFERVGLFRLDLSYQDPIRVLGGGEGGDDDDDDEEGSPPAVVPSIMHVTSIHPLQLNDRLFYGDRNFAEIWATDRFGSIDTYADWTRTSEIIPITGLHSETFVYYLLMEKWEVPIIKKDLCFWRVRASGEVRYDDCDLIGEGSGQEM